LSFYVGIVCLFKEHFLYFFILILYTNVLVQFRTHYHVWVWQLRYLARPLRVSTICLSHTRESAPSLPEFQTCCVHSPPLPGLIAELIKLMCMTWFAQSLVERAVFVPTLFHEQICS
jgi:hypothetical protein